MDTGATPRAYTNDFAEGDFDRRFGHQRKTSELIDPYLPALHFPVAKPKRENAGREDMDR
jgi:hypothetical protein